MGQASRRVIEARIAALKNLKVEHVGNDIYRIQNAATFWPAIDFWRMLDGSAQGYTTSSMLDAIDAGQLRSMIIEPATVTPPQPSTVTGRDSPLGRDHSILTDQSLDSQPQRAESVTVDASTKLPTVDWS